MKNGLDFRLSGRKRGIRQFDWLNFRFLTGKGKERWQRRFTVLYYGKRSCFFRLRPESENDIYFVSVGKAIGEGWEKRFLPDGKNNYKNCCGTGVSDTGRTRSADESDYAYCERKICKCEETECNPVSCPYAKGHFDRVNDAVYDLIMNYNEITRDVIENQSEKYMVCPFEMSLDVSLWVDAVICDYNYAFDPTAHLKRFFF